MKINQPLTYFLDKTIQTPLHLIDTRLFDFVNIIEKRLDKVLTELKTGK
ncbi:MAG: hypothetical protein ACXWFC_12165 [Nitrososphaeraceae archaeon]